MRGIMIGIYKIENTLTGECYIGQSTNIERRWEEHRRNALAKTKVRKYSMYRDMRRLGYSVFSFEVLEECLKSQLDEKENYWIRKYSETNHLYNIWYPKGVIRR